MGISYLIIITLVCLFAEGFCLVLSHINFAEKSVTRLKNILATLILLVLGVLTIFRGVNVGTDTKVYVGVFDALRDGVYLPEFKRWEIGFQWLNIFLSLFSRNPQTIIIATGFISYFLIGIYLARHVENKLLFVVLFYALLFSNYTNIIRQSIAGAILVFAYEQCKRGKHLKAILITLLAMLFHKATGVFILYIFLKRKKITNKVAMIIFLSILGISIFSASFFIDIFIKIAPQYQEYFVGERVGTGGLGTTMNLIIVLVMLSMYYIPRKKMGKSSEVLWLFLFCASITAMAYVMNNFLRAALVFYLPIMKECCSSFPQKKIDNAAVEFLGVLILLAFFVAIIVFRPEWNTLYPYEFYRN